MSTMKKRILFHLFFFIFPFMVFAQSQEGPPNVEKTGGIFPTEAQADEADAVTPNRSDLIKPGKRTRPTFTKELKIADQTQLLRDGRICGPGLSGIPLTGGSRGVRCENQGLDCHRQCCSGSGGSASYRRPVGAESGNEK